MSELAKAYQPADVEDRLYKTWLEQGLFTADPASPRPPFSIVIPPPNVTGILTLGHVLNNTLQDILCRRARMQGHEVLWLPGTDHAGLATQTRVEKMLEAEGLTREGLGRDAFLQRVRDWKDKHGGIIIQQLKKLGCSCDWSRERFTMDDGYSRAVLEAFVELHRRGHIYRGQRMVNWCPASLTAISDEEVVMTPQKGALYTVRYELCNHPGEYLEVATTRPETIMGDSALAVHPGDERYRRHIGASAWRPLDRAPIPIVADSHIDPAFGTGVLKVTPAHDRADFEIGRRHNLPARDILHPDGRIHCPEVPELDGLDRFKARRRSVELLQERGLLVKETPYENNVGFSERGQVPIEPRLSEQWFLRYPRVEEALAVVRDRLIRFWPERWEKVYNHWLENIQDWCISRQIWWGHRIPVWYRGTETLCQIDSPGPDWRQDPDALDTWFSSWLWAYATMDEAARHKFYPTSVLVTGPDIIFLWVARMIIAGLEFQPGRGDTPAAHIPFRNVYFTGLIRDAKGRKLSKSLGNSPDPLDLIARYGADGLRFGLLRVAPQGLDIRYEEKQIEEGRNFCNKLWNASRFRAGHGPIDPRANPSAHTLTPFAHLLLQQLRDTVLRVNAHYDAYEFNQVAATLYAFVWDDFCARFLEAAKPDLHDPSSPTRPGTLAVFDFALSHILRLLHPFTPFLTEELWLQLGLSRETIQRAPWPDATAIAFDPAPAAAARQIYETVDAARSLRGDYQLPPTKALRFLLHASGPADTAALARLLNADPLDLVGAIPPKTPLRLTPLGELALPLEGLIDPGQEKTRLRKLIDKAEADLAREDAKLGNEAMCARAPAEKVEEWRALRADAATRATRYREQLRQLG